MTVLMALISSRVGLVAAVCVCEMLGACSACGAGKRVGATDAGTPGPDGTPLTADATGADSSSTDALPPTGLAGGDVSFDVHCCTAPPNASNLISASKRAQIGPGVEFAAIGSAGPHVINADVDVSSMGIDIKYRANVTPSPGQFNGYVFRFMDHDSDKNTGPMIARATRNALTRSDPVQGSGLMPIQFS